MVMETHATDARADGTRGAVCIQIYCAHDELVAVEALVGNPRNPNQHPPAQIALLAKIIAAQGWRAPITVSKRSGFVVRGHGRLAAALLLGVEQAPVDYQDYESEAAEWADLIADNRIAELAEIDLSALNDLLTELDAAEFDMGLTGFDGGELERLMTSLGDFGSEVEEDDVPDLPEAPISRPGDLWMLGDHRVLCGDSTRAQDMGRLMGGAQAVCLWTDPPYGVEYVGKTKAAKRIKNDGAATLGPLLAGAFTAASGALVSGSPFYIAHPAGPLALVFESAVRDVGWKVHESLVWVKDSMVLGHSDYHYRHEPILYGWTKGEGRSGRGKQSASRWFGDNAQTSVFEIPRPRRSEEHPTMKPVALVSAMLANSVPIGGLVLDPFLGSGTTLIAAEQLGRVCFGLELDPAYVDVIVKRWENLTSRTAVLHTCEKQ